MGCDIHTFVEKRVNGKWEVVEGKNKWRDFLKDSGNDNWEKEPKTCIEGWIYDGRSYTLFSWLADVRNSMRGYRNDPITGHTITPLASPKGLPEDCSECVKDYLYDGDIHSCSYFTFNEILEGVSDEKVKYAGLVGPGEYKIFKEKGYPEGWCGGSSAHFVSNEAMEMYINGEDVVATKPALLSYNGREVVKKEEQELMNIKDNKNHFIMTLIHWEVPLRDCVSDFIDVIKEVAKEYENLDDVRIVFGFDN